MKVGFKHSAETRERMRIAQRDRAPISEATRERMRQSALSKPSINEETRERIRVGQITRRKREAIQSGMDEAEYDRQELLGNRWCSHCRQYHSAATFHDARKRLCNECLKQKLKDSYARHKVSRTQTRRAVYHFRRDKTRIMSLRRYGVTPEWFDETMAAQGNSCAICGTPEPEDGPRYSVDHNHLCCSEKKRSCGKCVRGILCSRCNQSIERLEHDIDWAKKAMQYLARYPLNGTDAAKLA